MASWDSLFSTVTEWLDYSSINDATGQPAAYGSNVTGSLVPSTVTTVRPDASFTADGVTWRVQGPSSAYSTDNGRTTVRAISRGADGSVQLGAVLNSYSDAGAWYSDPTAIDFYKGAAAVAAAAVGMTYGLPALTGEAAPASTASLGWGLDGAAGDTVATWNVGGDAIVGTAGGTASGWTTGAGLDGAAGDTFATYTVGNGPINAAAATTAAASSTGSSLSSTLQSIVASPVAQTVARGTVALLTGTTALSATGSQQPRQAQPVTTSAGLNVPPLVLILGAVALLMAH